MDSLKKMLMPDLNPLVTTFGSVPLETLLEHQISVYDISSSVVTKLGKDDSAAINFKKQGDNLLQQHKFEEAAEAYGNSLCVAKPNSNTLGICYYSRARLFQRMKQYEYALADIDHTLECLLSEGIKKQVMDVKEKLISLKANRQNEKINKKHLQNKMTQNNVSLSDVENSELPGVSSAIKLCYNTEYGRHFVAEKPVKTGDVLMIQDAYTKVVMEAKRFHFCGYCLKSTTALIPCETCTIALYCSHECRTNAYEEYHRTECKLPVYDEELLPILRLFLIITDQGTKLREVMSRVKEQQSTKDRRIVGFTDGKFVGNSVEAVLSLTSHVDKSSCRPLTQLASKIIIILKKYSNILDNYDMREVALFMYLLVCTYACNMLVIREKSLQDPLAKALYPVFNLLNHSCINNTIWYNSKYRYRVLVACQDVKKGEQIFNNYFVGDMILFQEAEFRKQYFTRIKHFTCQCEACKNNYSFTHELRRLKVPPRIKRQLRKNPVDIESMWEVLKCLNREIRKPCLEVLMMKYAMIEAYLNNHDMLIKLYNAFGIL